MKKKMLLALALVMLVVAGCGKNAAPNGPQGSTPNTPATGGQTPPANGGSGSNTSSGGQSTAPLPGMNAPSAAPQKQEFEKVDLGPFKAGEVAKIGPLEVTVTSFTKKTKAPGLPANSSLAYVLVNVSIKNTGTADYPINLSEHFKFFNVAGKSYVISVAATNTEQKRLSGTVKPGETAEGFIGYMPSLSPGTNKLVYQHPDWGTAFWEYPS